VYVWCYSFSENGASYGANYGANYEYTTCDEMCKMSLRNESDRATTIALTAGRSIRKRPHGWFLTPARCSCSFDFHPSFALYCEDKYIHWIYCGKSTRRRTIRDERSLAASRSLVRDGEGRPHGLLLNKGDSRSLRA